MSQPALASADTFSESPKDRGDLLHCTLALTIDGAVHNVPGGQIKHLSIQALPHGFSGTCEFVLVDDTSLSGPHQDKLCADFVGDAPIAITLEVHPVLVDVKPRASAAPFRLAGYVTARWLSEHALASSPTTTRVRRYRIDFTDAAQFVWTQHFPCALYVDKSYREVLEANRGPLIQLTYDWKLLTTKQPHVFLGHEPHERAASFYDFVLWIVTSHGGFFVYDYAQHRYALAESKPVAGPESELHPADISSLRLAYPQLPRHVVRVHNSDAELAKTTAIHPRETKREVTGIQHDYLLRTPLSSAVEERATREQRRLFAAYAPKLEATFSRWPTSALCPGSAVQLSEKELFLVTGTVLPSAFAGAKARVDAVTLSADAVGQNPDDGFGSDRTSFHVRGTVSLRHEDDRRPTQIPFVPPSYPRLLEGKIVCEEGEDEDKTYQIFEDPDTGIESYNVEIPLFENQRIRVDFQPLLQSGHFYFPAYKKARVLVAVDLDRAWLVRYLDWRPEGRVPKETQGNHLLVGKRPQNGASLRHVYEDNKPVLRIKRTHDKDTQLLEVAEGHLLLQVEDEDHPKGTLGCAIRLDKEKGGAVTIENGTDEVTQSIRMDGRKVEIRVKGKEDESLVTQTQSAVIIQCKSFQLDADTIECRSKGITSHRSDDSLSVQSAKAMELGSSTKMTVRAKEELQGQAARIVLRGDRDIALSGQGAGFSAGEGTAQVEGATVKLMGSGQLTAEGGMVELAAQSMLKAEATGVLTVKGGITNIQGSLVKLG